MILFNKVHRLFIVYILQGVKNMKFSSQQEANTAKNGLYDLAWILIELLDQKEYCTVQEAVTALDTSASSFLHEKFHTTSRFGNSIDYSIANKVLQEFNVSSCGEVQRKYSVSNNGLCYMLIKIMDILANDSSSFTVYE